MTDRKRRVRPELIPKGVQTLSFMADLVDFEPCNDDGWAHTPEQHIALFLRALEELEQKATEALEGPDAEGDFRFARAAKGILEHVATLRGSLERESRSAETATVAALELGAALEIGALAAELGIKPYMGDLSSGKAVRDGGRKGHETKYGNPQEKKARRERQQQVVNEVRAEFPEISKGELWKKASRRLEGEGNSPRSLRRYCRDPRDRLSQK